MYFLLAYSKVRFLIGGIGCLILILAACNGTARDEATEKDTPAIVQDGVKAVAYVGDRPVTEAEWKQARAYAEVMMLLLAEPGTVLDESTALQVV